MMRCNAAAPLKTKERSYDKLLHVAWVSVATTAAVGTEPCNEVFDSSVPMDAYIIFDGNLFSTNGGRIGW